jgi:hypothetical protein
MVFVPEEQIHITVGIFNAKFFRSGHVVYAYFTRHVCFLNFLARHQHGGVQKQTNEKEKIFDICSHNGTF